MRQSTSSVWFGGLLLSVATACNSLDAVSPQPGTRMIIPVDARPTQQALSTPPAISGGTLAITLDGRFAVAADPDRDRVSIVELQSGITRHVALQPGDEPGRVVVDGVDHAYIALRRAGDVASLDLPSAQIDRRNHVCSAPRGMAFDWGNGLLHVACADGRLVTLKAATGESVRELNLEPDLRDVLVHGDGLLVSTFKRAEVLHVDASGEVGLRDGALPFSVNVLDVKRRNTNTMGGDVAFDDGVTQQPMSAHLAWRMAQNQNGEVYMLHQGESLNVVDIQTKPSGTNSSPYGGGSGFGCGGIVTPALTHLDGRGQTQTVGVQSGVLSVDLAVSATDGRVAIAQAGQVDPSAPRPTVVFGSSGSDVAAPTAAFGFPGQFDVSSSNALPKDIDPAVAGSSIVTVMQSQQMGFKGQVPTPGGCQSGLPVRVIGQATAVAFTPAGDLVVQSREPALLSVVPSTPALMGVGGQGKVFSLAGDSVRDTGHEIFHRDAGGGIACASCHAEGAEDGHTWSFTGIGIRRTQALHVGLQGTEPFHWSGDESNLGHIMEDVFVGRMGGVHQGEGRLGALSDWLFALRPPAPIMAADDAAAVRGEQLFQSGATGCTGCHNGAKFTNNKTVDVGTGGKLQVPSLVGVGYRAPLMHTGCAATLAERFNPDCGGSQHGHTAQLSTAEISDMVAYLQTL
jgi:mono/diheme cytochrome c family protein